MKKLIYLAAAILAYPLMQSCTQHEVPFYAGEDAIFFDQQYGTGNFDSLRQAHQLYSLIAFGSMNTPDSLLRVKVETTGYVRDYDREFAVEVVEDSTTMIEGEDFILESRNAMIPAGQNSTRISVHIFRTEHIHEGTQQLQIRLVPGQHFVLPFGETGIGILPLRKTSSDVYREFSTNTDPSIHNIFANVRLEQPNGWNPGRFGTYSEKKYAMMLEITEERFGWGVSAYHPDSDQKMKLRRAMTVATVVSEYLMEQYRKGREYWVLDEDGTMMWIEGVTWAEGTDPDMMV